MTDTDGKIINRKENKDEVSTPDDVAALYSWANLHGAKYRDFSATRAEIRTLNRTRPEGDETILTPPEVVVPTAAPPVAAPVSASTIGPVSSTPIAPVSSTPMQIASPERKKPNADVLAEMLARVEGPRVEAMEMASPQPVPTSSAAQQARDLTPPLQMPRPKPPQKQFAASAPEYTPGAESSWPEEKSGSAFSHQEEAQPRMVPGRLQRAHQHSETGLPAVSASRAGSRWFALSRAFEEGQKEQNVALHKQLGLPTLAVFSLAGGVGKTSLVATLGRALAGSGERVLMVDTTSYGLLPFYFGARDQRPGLVRTFSSGSKMAPIQVMSLDAEQHTEGGSYQVESQDWLLDEISRGSQGVSRILIDVTTGALSLMSLVLRLSPGVLVPVSPDMSSVMSLQTVEGYFQRQEDGNGHPVRPFYILNQFDSDLPLHLDVRELLRERLGDRLLPFVLRRSASVSEALAEGMTVLDYSPNSPVTEDYTSLAGWTRSLAVPESGGFRGVRWSER